VATPINTSAERTAAPDSATAQNVDLGGFRERSLNRGVNPVIYRVLRSLLVPFFLVYLRSRGPGRCCSPPTTAASSTPS
jgi:hypothetical protein